MAIFRGTRNDDILGGTNQADRVSGGYGDDEIWGFDGNDRIWGDYGDDFLQSGEGVNEIHGGAGDDNIGDECGNTRLEDGRSLLFGDRGDDGISASNARMEGGPGDDSLSGALDNAINTSCWVEMTGGRGGDWFYMNASNNGVVDWLDVYDFRASEGDLLFLSLQNENDPARSDDNDLDTRRTSDFFRELAGADGILDDSDLGALWDGRALQVEVGGDGVAETFDGDRLLLWGHSAVTADSFFMG